MLSYSTGTSGAGSDVEKVDQATKLAKQRRPDLLIDGPLQYDAAIMPDVAKRIASAGMQIVLNTPEEFDAQIRAETVKWGKVIRDFNIQVE